jgi:hypothetical protein
MKQKDLAIILGSMAVFTLLWVGFGLWHIYTTSTIKEPITSQLLQIPGTFNTGVIDNLKKRTSVTSQNVTLQAATPSAEEQLPTLLSPTSSLSASPTPELSPSPTSTTSGGGI